MKRTRAAFGVLLTTLVLAVGLGAPSSAATAGPTAKVVRLGFFANLTHAPALIAQDKEYFEKALGPGTTIQYVLFNAGPAAVEAMKGGAIDMAYVGPNPAISGYASTNGTLLRVVSGVTSGGAQLVVRPQIKTPADLKGTTIASPQLGNTQDVALRSWLKSKGYRTSVVGTGDVAVAPTENATALTIFRQNRIQGAWVPEPWASRLVLEGGGHVLVDEKSLWPGGRFVTTNLIASQKFLDAYPGTVSAVISANQTAIEFIKSNPGQAKSITQRSISGWTGKTLPKVAVDRAWSNLRFTSDPLPLTLKKSAEDAVSAGLLTLPAGKLNGIYDLRLLNSVLKARKQTPVTAGGLGQQ